MNILHICRLDNVTDDSDLIYSNSYSKIYYTSNKNYSLRRDRGSVGQLLDKFFFKQYIIRTFKINGFTITI